MPDFDDWTSSEGGSRPDSADRVPPWLAAWGVSDRRPWLDAIVAAEMPGLGEGPHDVGLAQLLGGKSAAALTPLQRSGLWLLAGDLDRSHSISQDDSSAEGSFWHGIMHRREGDFGNAKYWFRRVGNHPVLDALSQKYPTEHSDATTFVDAVQTAVRSGRGTLDCQRVQWTEWQWLMNAS